MGESKGQRLKTVQLSTSRTNQYLLLEAVGVPSFVLAIHNGGHVPIYEGAVDCSTFDNMFDHLVKIQKAWHARLGPNEAIS